MASRLYGTFLENEKKAAFNLATDTLKIALVTSAYTPNLDTHAAYADLTNEVVGAGYTAGGATLAGLSLTRTAANSWGASWAAATAYKVGQLVKPTAGNGFVYRCVVAGNSHATTEPTWPTTIGREVLDNTAVWVCAGSFVVKFTCTAPTWPASTITARAGVVYDTTAANKLVCYVDFGADVSSTAGTFTVTPDANSGLFDQTA
jgi:hypothetical protein